MGVLSLFSGLIVWLYSGYLPIGFNDSFLWLLPKSNFVDGDSKAKDTRPLSGANTDAKIFAMVLAHIFNSSIDVWAIGIQRGFIRGRQMLQNIIEIEAKAMSTMYTSSNGALVLFDFSAAFLSVARRFIWLVLESIGLPKFVISAIKALYANNHHFLKWSGVTQYAFLCMAGVRQGCPLSSALFISLSATLF